MFSESLEIKLKLEIKGQRFEIPCGNIKKFDLDLHASGFEGMVGFGLFSDSSEDELFPKFIKHDLIKIHLWIIRVHNLREKKTEPIKLTAYVTHKSVREFYYTEVKNEPVLQRYYEISFQDIQAVLWKQHFPVKLYTNKKMCDVIMAQAVEDLLIEIDLSVCQEENEMTFLGLEKNNHDASFYDFLMWYVHSNNLVLVYDYVAQKLRLLDKKPGPGPEDVFRPLEVKDIKTIFPETLRHTTRILNAHSQKFEVIEIPQPHDVQQITQDIVMRTAVKKELNDIKEIETSKLYPPMEGLELILKAFPAKSCTVGTMVTFEKEYWGEKTLLLDKTFRVLDIHLSAAAQDQDLSEHYTADHAAYNVEMVIKMELMDNPLVHLPGFKMPSYPVLVEGKIVSESGADDDKTYQIYTNKETSQDNYTVHVPLWDLKVKAPFIPNVFSGHFYFPAFKHARVVLALYFDRAEIISFLDWGEGSRLPMDTQGNHILFGKNKDSKTSMKYLYSEGKPVFTIKRTSDTETEMIQMEEESIILQTKDDE